MTARPAAAAEPTPGPAPDRPPTADPGDQQPDPRRWKAFSVCLVAGFMSLLDVSIVNVALPSLRDGLQASESDLQWVVSGYALAFGLVLVPAGRLGDVRGRRRMFVAGVVLFTLASAACGFAPTAGALTAARLLQGVGGGLINPQVSGFVQELFRGRERGTAFGLLGTTIGLSTAVGPLTGGALIAAFGPDLGWRAVFFVNVPIGVLAVVLALRLLPAGSGRRPSADLDPVGVVLLGTGVLLLLLPLVQERSWQGSAKWLLLPAGVLLLVLFAAWERRYAAGGREAMVQLDLFRLRSYGVGTGLSLVYFAGFTAIFFVLALYLQSGLGYSALGAGLAVTPFALGSAAGSAVGGRLVGRFGRPMVALGLLSTLLGLLGTDVVLARVGSGPSTGWAIAAPLLVAGIGSGLVISPNITLSLAQVPLPRAGSAGAVLQTAQRIGGATGIAAVGSVFFSRLAADGDHDAAIGSALRLCTGIVAVALVVALADLRGSRPGQATETPIR